LTWRQLLLQETQIQVLGFDFINELYEEYAYLIEEFEACKSHASQEHSFWIDYLIQYWFIFKNNQLCIPDHSMGGNSIKEKHSGGLGGHFGQKKTYELLRRYYYCPNLRSDVQSLWRDAVSMPKEEAKTLDYIPHCQFQSPWDSISMDFFWIS